MYFMIKSQKKLEKVKNKNFKKEVGNMIKSIDSLNLISEKYEHFRYEKWNN